MARARDEKLAQDSASASATSSASSSEFPSGSYWPIALAATLTLAVIGLIIHPGISVLGAVLCLVVIVAWSLERFHLVSPTVPGGKQAKVLTKARGDYTDLDAVPDAGLRARGWGLIWFIASEAVFFANLIGAYLYLRAFGAHHGASLPAEALHLELTFPSVNTVILLASGIPAYYGQRAIKKGDVRGLRIGFLVAVLLGTIFLAGQGFEYSKLGFAPQSSALAAGFFVLTGFHGVHVAAGIGIMLMVLALSIRGRYSAKNHFAVEVAGTYWHFVDIVWIFLFITLYLYR